MDVLVENEVICELKAVDTLNPVWSAQISKPAQTHRQSTMIFN
ncbi:GxxExxY protein [Membranihabitans maritimus]